MVENTVGKGEIALYEQFLLFPQCFQKACFPGASKGVIVWESVNGQILPVGQAVYFSGHSFTDNRLHIRYTDLNSMFVMVFKLITCIILNTSCV